ncbi:MAG TPA: hypothetical protein DDY32_00985 [Desulfobulbaceae bacterium]|nr:hypothetical protein [Desulfobulbaceae bacterium]
MVSAQPSVFICYSREDKAHALRLAADLQSRGARVWIDALEIVPGQKWQRAIERAISTCRFFVALMSYHSVDKNGYVQKELNLALSLLERHPPDDIFVIPARLEDCHPRHPQLADLQWADLFDSWDKAVAGIARSLGLIGSLPGEGFDPTTGLISGSLFQHFLSMEVARARRSRGACALFSLAIDQLEAVFGNHGPELRDRLLATSGIVLRSAMRTYDHVVRRSDDLFAVITPDVSEKDVLEIGERLCTFFAEEPLLIPFGSQMSEALPSKLTLSIGIALFPVHGDTETLIERSARQAVEQARVAGGNCVILYSPT